MTPGTFSDYHFYIRPSENKCLSTVGTPNKGTPNKGIFPYLTRNIKNGK